MYGKVPGKPLFTVTRLMLYPHQQGLFMISSLKGCLVGEKETTGELGPAQRGDQFLTANLRLSCVGRSTCRIFSGDNAWGSATVNRGHAATAITLWLASFGGRPRRLGAAQAGKGTW